MLIKLNGLNRKLNSGINKNSGLKLISKKKTMRSLLYIIAVILVIGWAISVFAYAVGGLIHILLVIAIISLILGVIRRP